MKVVTEMFKELFEQIKNVDIKECETQTEKGLINIIKCGIPLPDNATNGDVIKALFPNIEAETYGVITSVKGLDCDKGALDPYRQFWSEWWNAPYKTESEVEE